MGIMDRFTRQLDASKQMGKLRADATLDLLMKRLGRKKEPMDVKTVRIEFKDGRVETIVPYQSFKLEKQSPLSGSDACDVLFMVSVNEWYEPGEYEKKQAEVKPSA